MYISSNDTTNRRPGEVRYLETHDMTSRPLLLHCRWVSMIIRLSVRLHVSVYSDAGRHRLSAAHVVSERGTNLRLLSLPRTASPTSVDGVVRQVHVAGRDRQAE